MAETKRSPENILSALLEEFQGVPGSEASGLRELIASTTEECPDVD